MKHANTPIAASKVTPPASAHSTHGKSTGLACTTTLPSPGIARSPVLELFQLARRLYPYTWAHYSVQKKLFQMKTDGAILPKMPARLPSVPQFSTMSATVRSFRLMLHIASLAIIIEMLQSKRHLPADQSKSVACQIRNAKQRLRRACRHAEQTGLWHNGRWQIGRLMTVVTKPAK